jgi:hypothetical protein
MTNTGVLKGDSFRDGGLGLLSSNLEVDVAGRSEPVY